MKNPLPLRRLKAMSAEDLMVISSTLQDAIIPIGDVGFETGTGQFVFVANRFCWEAMRDETTQVPALRINAGVTFSNVVAVRQRGIDFRDRGAFLNLLAISCLSEPDCGEPTIELTFSGEIRIRLETVGLLCHLEDFGEPWPTQWRPQHADD